MRNRYSVTIPRSVAIRLEALAYSRRLAAIEQGGRGPRAADLVHEAIDEYLAAHHDDQAESSPAAVSGQTATPTALEEL